MHYFSTFLTAKRGIITCLLTLRILVALGQEPDTLRFQAPSQPKQHQLSWKVDASLLGVAAISGVSSFVLEQRVNAYTLADLSRFDRSQVNALDRGATYNWSPTAFRISDQTLTANFVSTGLVLIPTLFRGNRLATVALMYVEVLAIPTLVQQTVKNIALRTRPYVYNPDAPLAAKLIPNGRQSFFSGHAGTAFASAVFAGELFGVYYPHSRWKPVVWVVMLGLASTTAIMRYEAGYHYPTDIVVGAAFGSLVGWLVPKLHESVRPSAITHRLRLTPWSNGVATGIQARLIFGASTAVPKSTSQ